MHLPFGREGERQMESDEQQDLAKNVREALRGTRNLREVKMFGGVGFMLNDNMTVAASKRGLLVRVGKEGQADALKRPGSRPMVMKGRTMAGYIYVDPPHLTAESVRDWVQIAAAFVRTLPAKARATKTAPRKMKRK
jgi:TfoX/Sxy family transcriptional regulator of competence genes